MSKIAKEFESVKEKAVIPPAVGGEEMSKIAKEFESVKENIIRQF